MTVKTWRITADEAERDQRQAAGGLAARGLRAGDRVAMALSNSPALLAVTLGALRTGIVPVLINASLLPHEVADLVADADPALIIPDQVALEAVLAGPPAALSPVPLARPMHYTSGTSGTPKGVWTGVLAESEARALVEEEADLWGFGRSDVHLVCSPLYHSVSVRLSTAVLRRGGSVVLLEHFEAEAWRSALLGQEVTTAFVVPAHLQRVFATGGVTAPPGFRRLIHAGAPCPEPLKRDALARFPPGTVWEFYGSTEGQFTVCSPEEWLERPGTVGRARPGRSLQIDGDTGQVWCRAPRFARFEYWRSPEATAEAWRGDAFSAGDLGRLDDDGYLYLDGRRDDLIISGGVNVYPVEVEHVLAGASGVHEVAVFGVPDERWGQRVCAAVVGDIEPEALIAWAHDRLAPYKCPKDVFVVGELPRTATGKVRRSRLAGVLGLDDARPGRA